MRAFDLGLLHLRNKRTRVILSNCVIRIPPSHILSIGGAEGGGEDEDEVWNNAKLLDYNRMVIARPLWYHHSRTCETMNNCAPVSADGGSNCIGRMFHRLRRRNSWKAQLSMRARYAGVWLQFAREL